MAWATGLTGAFCASPSRLNRSEGHDQPEGGGDARLWFHMNLFRSRGRTGRTNQGSVLKGRGLGLRLGVGFGGADGARWRPTAGACWAGAARHPSPRSSGEHEPPEGSPGGCFGSSYRGDGGTSIGTLAGADPICAEPGDFRRNAVDFEDVPGRPHAVAPPDGSSPFRRARFCAAARSAAAGQDQIRAAVPRRRRRERRAATPPVFGAGRQPYRPAGVGDRHVDHGQLETPGRVRPLSPRCGKRGVHRSAVHPPAPALIEEERSHVTQERARGLHPSVAAGPPARKSANSSSETWNGGP